MVDVGSGWTARLNRTDLEAANAPGDPLLLFRRWFEDAGEADLIDPTAMALATVDADGQPSVRTVLLKGFDADGFRFFTNYESRKARELEANPQAALVFWWDRLERQVRLEGRVRRVTPDVSDAYFASRPRDSQIGAHASPQSRPITSRKQLEEQLQRLEEQFGQDPVPRPSHWGGYTLRPEVIEFWQGRKSRLHDRLRYAWNGAGWRQERLAP